jgi:pimeloyl-ACP methyl ester carboxylesterase
MPKVEVNGIRINYEIHGAGQPVVLIGGLGADTFLWFRQVPELSEYFQLVAFDNRGAGESDKPNEPYSIPMLAQDTAGLMRALGIDRAHILGASLGGLIAQEFALTYPSMLDRLVLVCTSFAGRQSIRPSLLSMISILPALIRTGHPEADTRRSFAVFTSRRWRKTHADLVDRFVAWRVAHPQPPYAFKRQRDALKGFTTADRVTGIAAPTLIVHGESDRVVPVDNARLLAERIPNSRLVVLEDSGHACSIDQAETFNRVVIDFLTER